MWTTLLKEIRRADNPYLGGWAEGVHIFFIHQPTRFLVSALSGVLRVECAYWCHQWADWATPILWHYQFNSGINLMGVNSINQFLSISFWIRVSWLYVYRMGPTENLIWYLLVDFELGLPTFLFLCLHLILIDVLG